MIDANDWRTQLSWLTHAIIVVRWKWGLPTIWCVNLSQGYFYNDKITTGEQWYPENHGEKYEWEEDHKQTCN